MSIHGASWARLVRADEVTDPETSGIGWHLWAGRSHFPDEEMGSGFRYLLAEGPLAARRTEAVHTVTGFISWTDVVTVSAAYDVLIQRLGYKGARDLVGSRLEWLDNGYNVTKIGPRALRFCAWTYDSVPIDNVDVGRFDGSRTGWKRLEP